VDEARDRVHKQTDRCPGLWVVWADRRGNQDCRRKL